MIVNDSATDKKQDMYPQHAEHDDEPPPYDGPSTNYVHNSAPAPPQPQPGPSSASVPVFQPTQQQCVNGLSLFSRHDAISGTYLVDPLLPPVTVGYGNGGRRGRSVEKEHAKNVRKAFGSVPGRDDDSDASDRKSRSRRDAHRPEVNAAFRTRHGAIKVDVGIVNSAFQAAPSSDSQRKVHGRIMLSSRHGRISVNLTQIEFGRCADLDVSTRHGTITVFLAPTFHGVVALRSRRGRGGISFLPAFAARMRVVRGNDREMLLTLAPATVTAGAPPAGDDYCVIGTRHGKVNVGIYGIDSEADIAQSGGLSAQFDALIETGAKQLETWLAAGARALENNLQSRRLAMESSLQSKRLAIETSLQSKRLAAETSFQSRKFAAENALQSRRFAAEIALQSNKSAAEIAFQSNQSAAESARQARAMAMNTSLQARSQAALGAPISDFKRAN